MVDDVIAQSEDADRLDTTPAPVQARPQSVPMSDQGQGFANVAALARQPFKTDFSVPATDTPKSFAVTPGATDVDHGSDAPGRPAWSDTLAAEFRQNNTVGSMIASDALKASRYFDPEFDAWGAVKGTAYEPYWSRLADAGNAAQADAIKRDIDREQTDRKTLALAPWWQTIPMGLVASGLDWPMLIPGGSFVRGAKGGISIAGRMIEGGLTMGSATALQEAGLQMSQQTRTPGESVRNVAAGAAMGGIVGTGRPLVAAAGLGAMQGGTTAAEGGSPAEVGASVLLGAVLGGVGAKALSREEWRSGIDQLNEDLARADAGTPPVGHVPANRPASTVPTVDTLRELPLDDPAFVLSGDNQRFVAVRPGDPDIGNAPSVSHEGDLPVRFRRSDLKHIGNDVHKEDASILGYSDPWHMVTDVAATYDEVRQAGSDRIMLVKRGDPHGVAIVTLAKADGADYWRVVTSGRRRDEQLGDLVEVRERTPEAPSGTDAALAPIPGTAGKGVGFARPSTSDNIAASSAEGKSAGAAAVARPRMDDYSIAGRAASTVAEATRGLNPLLRLTQSESPVVREIANNLMENPLYLRMNREDGASPQAVATLTKEYHAGLAQALPAGRQAFRDFRKAGGQMSLPDFLEEVGKAMRRDDEHPIQQVAAAAKVYRAKVFDPPKNKAIEVGLLPADVEPKTAASYFTRKWSRNQINANEHGFKDRIASYFAPLIKQDFVESAQGMKSRLARLDQEVSDLGVSGDDRAYLLDRMETRRQELLVSPLMDQADRLSDLRNAVRDANRKGDATAAQAARDEAARIREQGGEPLAQHLDELSEINRRRATVGMNAAGLTERADRIYNQLADIDEANVRSMQRLVAKGEKLQKDAQRLDPAALSQRVEQMRDSFEAEHERIASANERIQKTAKRETIGRATPVPDTPAPRDLIGFLRDAGGIQDQGGNLKAMDLHRRRGLVKADGLPLDRAREMAAEAGYLGADTEHAVASTSVNDLLEALENHPTYSVRDDEAVHQRFVRAQSLEDRRRVSAAYEKTLKAIEAEHGLTEGEVNHLAMGDAVERVLHGEDPALAYDQAVARHQERAAAGIGTGSPNLDRLVQRQAEMERHLASSAERLRIAEGFDRQGALDEINASVERLKQEVSGVSQSRGERRAALLERMRQLDPKRVEDRLRAIEDARRDVQRRFYDRWEIDRQGERIDVDNPGAADFTEAARDIGNHLFDTFTGRGGEGVRPEFISVNVRGPMKERTLNVPDEIVEDFLEHNVEDVAHAYTRTMAADIELTRKFGSPDMRDAFARIKGDFELMRSKVTDPVTLKKLADIEENQVKDLAFVRDNIRGTRTPNTAERSLGNMIRTVNNLNYLRSMGKVVVGSLADAARPAMVHGLLPYMQTVPKLITNLDGIRMSVAEARLAGNAAEVALGHRMATLTEITDPLAQRGPIESVTHNLVETMNKWNGIRIWTDWMKSFSSVMVQNRILENAGAGRLNAREQAYMRYLGIDQSMSERISVQFQQHGETQAGIRVAGTEAWTDPQAVRAYRAAMNKDIDSIIVQPGPGDVPHWASTASGKMMLQFKTFTLASHQRVFLRGLQEGPARFIGGIVALTTAGMATRVLQALSTNGQDRLKEYRENPAALIGEGLDAGGGLALLMEGANTFEQATSVNPIKDAIGALGDSGPAKPARAPDPSKLLTGPAGGLFQNVGQAAHGATELMAGRPVPQQAKRGAVHLLPFNTAFGIQEFLNYLVAPPTQH